MATKKAGKKSEYKTMSGNPRPRPRGGAKGGSKKGGSKKGGSKKGGSKKR